MLLTINIGNTNILCGIWQDQSLARTERFPVSDISRLDTFFASPSQIEAVLVGAVNPHAAQDVLDAASRALNCPILAAGRDFEVPVRNRTRFPDRVGIDRLLNALAAYHRTRKPCVIIDIGTAVTIDAVNGAGEFLGGAIMPGLAGALSTLHSTTALLPHIDPARDRDIPVLGRDTEGAMSSGVFWGIVGAVEKISEMLRREAPGAVTFLTGGDAERFAPHLGGIDHTVAALALEGLRLAYLAR
ncbi:MAG: hypothetical protein DRP79_02995 [Planctomycetota bacterium]|nr:MAG: hypothetical protein DRP79_02995 [Planctomycetota bacterium]